MRKLTQYIVVHCSATVSDCDIGVSTIRDWHKQRGFKDIGYHFVIRRNGKIETGRKQDEVGAHVEGYNSRSVGVCMVGGIAKGGKAENNFTPAQFKTLETLLRKLTIDYPGAKIVGHRDLSPDRNGDGKITPNEYLKECPSFDIATWLKDINFNQ